MVIQCLSSTSDIPIGELAMSPSAETPTKKVRDKAQESERLYALMSPLAHMQGRYAVLAIPHESGTPLLCRLSTVKKIGEQARVWISNQYRERYGCSPLVCTYKDACTRIQAEKMVSCEIDQQGTQEKSATALLLEEVEEKAGWTEHASDVHARFARVYYKYPNVSGLWYLKGKGTRRLTDAYVEVVRVMRPAGASKNARYSSLTLRFTTAQGHVKLLEVTDDQFTSNELANKLSIFCTYPEDDKGRRYFLEAVRALARHEGVTAQEQVESLGWQMLEDGSLVWVMSNGCETRKGFVESDNAPCLSPSLPSTGNGYYGQDVPTSADVPQEDFYSLLLKEYVPHPDIDALQTALIGCEAAVQVPDGIPPDGIGVENGMLRVSPDIVGPTRHGKTRLLNAHQVAFGTRFTWSTSPLTTSVGGGCGDTGLGRNLLMAAMRYHLWNDFDHQAMPGTRDFEQHHKSRSDTLVNYAEGPTGGAKSSRTGEMRIRGTPSGCCIRTCNYDHALTSIEEEESMKEARACTFVWPQGIKGDDEVSRLLDTHRLQGYGLWQAYRRWLMDCIATDKDGFKANIAAMYQVAFDQVNDAQWAYDQHRNHAALMVFGVYIFLAFLEACRPGYFLIKWLEEHIPLLIENRVERGSYLKKLVDQKEDQKGLDVFVVTTLRKLFSQSAIYLRSQKDALLMEYEIDGLPFSLKDIGYRSVKREKVEDWESGRQCIGHLVHKRQDIALKTDLLMELLQEEAAKKKVPLGTERHTLALLIEKGIALPDRDKDGVLKQYEGRVNIAGKVSRYLIIPTSALFSAELVEGDNEEDEETPPNMNQFPIVSSQSNGSTPSDEEDMGGNYYGSFDVDPEEVPTVVDKSSREYVTIPR